MRFKTDWASLIVGSKFNVLALFYFVFEGNFPSTRPRGAYIWRGDLTEGFLRYRFGGLIHGGAYFRNFTVSLHWVIYHPAKFFFIPCVCILQRAHRLSSRLTFFPFVQVFMELEKLLRIHQL